MEQHAISLDDILARKQEAATDVVNVDEPTVKLVLFSLNEQWYAFQGENVCEILADCAVHFLPGCPASMEGIINVRGDIESVIRLHSILGLSGTQTTVSSRILLAKTATMRSGIRVDRVEEVLDVPQSAIQAPPHTLPDHLRPIVEGIVECREHMAHLLDLDRIFADYRAGLR